MIHVDSDEAKRQLAQATSLSDGMFVSLTVDSTVVPIAITVIKLVFVEKTLEALIIAVAY